MTVGHKSKRITELNQRLAYALASPRVRAWLGRAFHLVTTKDIPVLGMSSIGGRRVYLDRHFRTGLGPGVIRVKGRRLDTRPALIRHERLEQAVEDIFGWPYDEIAHPVATEYEHRLYRWKGFDPADVEAVLRGFIKSAEHERLKNVPTDLDLRPLFREPELFDRTKAAQDRNKVAQKAVGYTPRSATREKCALCSMFVQPKYGGPACTLVKDPIVPEGWCRRFKAGKLG